MNALPMLAASEWGLAIASGFVLLLFIIVGYVVIQGTRAQVAWRSRVEAGDVDAIHALVSDEVNRWKSARRPQNAEPAVWHGVQSAEILEVSPQGVRLSASAEGQYALVSGQRREVSSALREGMKLTAKLTDMILYDIPNVRLPYAQVDIYSTYRDDQGASQRCILSTRAEREFADDLDWDELDAEDIVRMLGGRYLLDDRGNPLPIEVDAPAPNSVPAAFYEDDE
ncbi:MAG TPA: hypothetical protein VIH21_12610 [Dehalococcoidia bacterium]